MQPNTNTFAPAFSLKEENHSIPSFAKGSKIVVIGAGAFGGWSALYLIRKGFKVTLIDAWGPGNSRSSSGDETRVIRSTYGNNKTYFDLNVRALTLWKENEFSFKKQLFYNQGVIWFCYQSQNPIIDESIPYAQSHGMAYEHLSVNEINRRYPIVNTDDLHHGYYDPYGGYLKARESSQAVTDAFIREGGEYIQGSVKPGNITSEYMHNIILEDGKVLQAAAYLFACGAWLPQLFPLVKDKIYCTKQEVYYFGVPSSHTILFENFPVWIDLDGNDHYYGIAGNAHRGFKVGVDKRGEDFNPTTGERIINGNVLLQAKQFLQHRFPILKNAPLLENRVCPYENTIDGNFIIDTHPQANNVILMGGGSGHGFKHGPAIGELVANALTGTSSLPSIFKCF